jgi:hypothetical protein
MASGDFSARGHRIGEVQSIDTPDTVSEHVRSGKASRKELHQEPTLKFVGGYPESWRWQQPRWLRLPLSFVDVVRFLCKELRSCRPTDSFIRAAPDAWRQSECTTVGARNDTEDCSLAESRRSGNLS